jgi:hypothetical protein
MYCDDKLSDIIKPPDLETLRFQCSQYVLIIKRGKQKIRRLNTYCLW